MGRKRTITRGLGPWLSVLPLAAVCATTLADQPTFASEGAQHCAVRQLEYALAARLRISDTPLGAGDGIVEAGPGRLTLRLSPIAGSPNELRAELLDYHMRNWFTVTAKVVFWSARVTTRAESRVAEGVAGRGTLSGRRLSWSGPIRGHRTDGTLTCTGSGCGLPGAPPEGESPLHIGPHPVAFEPFVFGSDDLDTFQMAYAKVSSTPQPRQTTHITLAGRKMSERCAEPPGQ